MEADGGSQGPALTEAVGQLREELRKAKDDHKMAIGTAGGAQRTPLPYSHFTGAISSLQRQMEIQESKLRRIRSEKEMLQKQLREQEVQLQAVSNKVQPKSVVAVAGRKAGSWEFRIFATNKLISELQETISQLRAEVVTTRLHLLEQKQAKKVIQSQAEALQLKELQTRVALERISTKFERYRSKIIQATFSVEGIQDPPDELTDDQVLEAMQVRGSSKQLPQMLKNKGSRVSRVSSDSHTASPTTARRKYSSKIEKPP
uniref:Uncharacterized protein n=1 Tax=Corvus moneduloides TaxID=1196302 RepID=A0A8C3DY28_CORMO